MRVNPPFTNISDPSLVAPLAFIDGAESIINGTEFAGQAGLKQQVVEEGGVGEDEVEEPLVDALYELEKVVSDVHRECMDISEFLGPQRGSIEANVRACVEGIVRVAKKLGISNVNRNKLLKEHSYEAYVNISNEINGRIDELRKLYGEDEEVDDRLSLISTVLRTIMYKMMALKSPLARGMNILIAYGTNYAHFEFTPFIILTLAYARIDERGQKRVVILPIITTYDQLYIIKSLALIEMNYHITSLLNSSKEEHTTPSKTQ